MLGTANPADVFTKHSLTREKILELVTLFDCKFSTGRAASAPALRTDTGTKKTMASFEDEQLCQLDEADTAAEQPASMPHKVYSQEQLDQLHPSLEAPDDFDVQGMEAQEPLLDAGMAEVDRITTPMRTLGRTRRDHTVRRATSVQLVVRNNRMFGG